MFISMFLLSFVEFCNTFYAVPRLFWADIIFLIQKSKFNELYKKDRIVKFKSVDFYHILQKKKKSSKNKKKSFISFMKLWSDNTNIRIGKHIIKLILFFFHFVFKSFLCDLLKLISWGIMLILLLRCCRISLIQNSVINLFWCIFIIHLFLIGTVIFFTVITYLKVILIFLLFKHIFLTFLYIFLWRLKISFFTDSFVETFLNIFHDLFIVNFSVRIVPFFEL